MTPTTSQPTRTAAHAEAETGAGTTIDSISSPTPCDGKTTRLYEEYEPAISAGFVVTVCAERLMQICLQFRVTFTIS